MWKNPTLDSDGAAGVELIWAGLSGRLDSGISQ
jgi:hypothetical protein